MKSYRLMSIIGVLIVFSMVLAPLSISFADQAPNPNRPDFANLRPSDHQPTVIDSFDVDALESAVYIVRLEDPALASYTGGIAALDATSPAATGARKLDVTAPESVAYLDYLAGEQAALVRNMEDTLNRKIEVKFQYLNVLNGMAVEMTGKEAGQVAKLPGVAEVQKDTVVYLDTDVGPGWIGAPEIWNGVDYWPDTSSMGEGVIIGVIDTGINFDHPSFADIGGDGYDHTNPWGSGVYVGVCDPGSTQYDATYTCNDKLIGAWTYTKGDPDEPGDVTPEDTDGHGSHTASTAAGNVVTGTLASSTYTYTATLSGVAPHANIIAYDVFPGGESQFTSIINMALDRATADGVDVVNFSISGDDDPWNSTTEVIFLDMFNAGIFVSASAGNSGPDAGTVRHTSPWALTVASTTHNRIFTKTLEDLSGGTSTLPDITGLGATGGYGPAPIVYAGDYGSGLTATPELCGVGALGDFISPWPPGTFSGEIVVCDRGAFGRVEKGANVLAAGAGGYILADNGSGLVGEAHDLPGIHINQTDGQALKDWLASGSGHMGTISETIVDTSGNGADILAGSSSRGPSKFDLLNPDVAAPGVSVLAAQYDSSTTPSADAEFGLLSGTSMAAPHAAGSAALIIGLHPSYTPDEVKSILMLTAENSGIYKEDGVTPADPFDMGSGRLDLEAAGNSWIRMKETYANFVAANPDIGGEPSTLNVPSMQDNTCFQTCAFERTMTHEVLGGPWTVSAMSYDPSVEISASQGPPRNVSTPDATRVWTNFDIFVDVDVRAALPEQWYFGEVVLTDQSGRGMDAHLPIAVFSISSSDIAQFTKTVDDNTAVAGETVSYDLTATNLSVFTRTFTITDTLPVEMSFVTVTVDGPGTAQHLGGQEVGWTGDLAGGNIGFDEVDLGGYLPLSLFFSPIPPPSNPDDGGYLITGMDFDYFGDNYNSAVWWVNGYLQAGDISGSPSNQYLPNPAQPNGVIAPWWTDLDLTNSGNWYFGTLTDGVTFWDVFEWEEVPKFVDPTAKFTFQIWIELGTDVIWFSYGDMDNGAGLNVWGTIGFEDPNGIVGATHYFDGAGSIPTLDLLTFAENGESVVVTVDALLNSGSWWDVIVNNAFMEVEGEMHAAWASIFYDYPVFFPFMSKQ